MYYTDVITILTQLRQNYDGDELEAIDTAIQVLDCQVSHITHPPESEFKYTDEDNEHNIFIRKEGCQK